VKLTLKKPVVVGTGAPVTELIFREEVVAGDLRGIKLSGLADALTEDILKVAGRLCGQSDPTMNGLCSADLIKVAEVVGGFLTAGLETGSENSPS
jgi:hypothetical protein